MADLVRIRIEDKGVLAALAALRARADDPRPALAEAGAALVTRIQLGFRDSQTPWGTPWAALELRDGKPLRDTGRLGNSITYRVIGKTGFEVGTTIPYAPTHQYGATIRPKKGPRLVFRPRGFKHPIFARQVTIPARPFLPIRDGRADLPADWTADVLEALSAFVGGPG